MATARSIARETQPPSLTKAPLTVETAIARATQPDRVVESRDSSGNWIEKRGKIRCVSPTQAPWYMEGHAVLTLCEVGKG